MKQPQLVGAIVHKVNTFAPRHDHQAKERARSARFDRLGGYVNTRRGDFHQVSVVGIGNQDVSVGSQGQPKRAVQRAMGEHSSPGTGRRVAGLCVRNGYDPILQGIRDVESPIGAKHQPGWPDH